MSKLIEVTDATFEDEVRNSRGTVLVDFWAGWCGPCHVLAPTIAEIAEEQGVKVGKLEIDENPDTAERYGIRSIPTVVLFRDGEAVEQLLGVQPKQAYVDAIQRVGAPA